MDVAIAFLTRYYLVLFVSERVTTDSNVNMHFPCEVRMPYVVLKAGCLLDCLFWLRKVATIIAQKRPLYVYVTEFANLVSVFFLL